MGVNSKKLLKFVAMGLLLVSCLNIQTRAVAHHSLMYNTACRFALLEQELDKIIESKTSASFDTSIPGDSAAKLSESFSLAAHKAVTIGVVYFPSTAKLDIGMIHPNGSFHYFSTTGGWVSKIVRVAEAGNYTLAIRNNASDEIDIFGFVNYY